VDASIYRKTHCQIFDTGATHGNSKDTSINRKIDAFVQTLQKFTAAGLGTKNFYFQDRKKWKFQDIFQDIRTTYSD